jgi:hypothetical protein
MKNKKERIFDFIVIGAPKCGTTYTYQILKEHPRITISSSKDGIKGGYFDSNTNQKTREYIKKISKNTGKVVGEFREGYYMKGPEMASKLHEHNQNMRLIVCLRNPYERAFSAYKHLSLLKEPKGDFLENKSEYNYILEKGYFYKYIKPFFDLFPSKQILLLDFEELKNNPEAYRKKLYRFLNIDTNFIPSTEGKQLNDTRFKGTWLGQFVHNSFIPLVDSVGLGRTIRSSKTARSILYRVGSFLGKRLKQKKQNLLSKENFMKKTEKLYDKDISKLEKLTKKQAFWL